MRWTMLISSMKKADDIETEKINLGSTSPLEWFRSEQCHELEEYMRYCVKQIAASLAMKPEDFNGQSATAIKVYNDKLEELNRQGDKG